MFDKGILPFISCISFLLLIVPVNTSTVYVDGVVSPGVRETDDISYNESDVDDTAVDVGKDGIGVIDTQGSDGGAPNGKSISGGGPSGGSSSGGSSGGSSFSDTPDMSDSDISDSDVSDTHDVADTDISDSDVSEDVQTDGDSHKITIINLFKSSINWNFRKTPQDTPIIGIIS